MPAADELYLLSQQSSDICDVTIKSWAAHFDWLEEVLALAKQSRGDTIVPKTPSRKKKVNRNVEDVENLPPPDTRRKPSRAAAKAASEKNKSIIELSSKRKLRRPSSPRRESPKNVVIQSESEEVEDDVEIIEEEVKQKERSTVSSPIVSDQPDDTRKSPEKDNDVDSCISDDVFEVEEMKEEFKVPAPVLSESRKEDEKEFKVPPVPTLPKEEVLSTSSSEDIRPVRTTRTKKRQTQEPPKEKLPERTTRTKKRKMEEENSNSTTKISKEESAISLATVAKGESPLRLRISESDDSSDASRGESKSKTDYRQSPVEPAKRMTRSKVRQIAKTSPVKLCLTPKKQSPLLAKNFSGSPISRSPVTKNKKIFKDGKGKGNSVQEVSVESIQISSSPGKVVRHHRFESSKTITPSYTKKFVYQTPPPASNSAIKPNGLKGLLSSGSLQSSYSHKRGPLLSSSPQVTGTKQLGTPTESNRTRNILTGPSFLTRVQPSKPSREEEGERKTEELLRKREREEETRRKREELLRIKMEEQKRKNEDRMRRVQEAREAREKKVAEAREAQEREKKMREERVEEEKRRKAREAKKKEEAKMMMMRRQFEEEQRLKEEQSLREEQRLKEERRQVEEQRMKEEARKMEERRARMEEQKRILAQKREAERVSRERHEAEKIRDQERIARERREMESLKSKEDNRNSSSAKKMNETYTTEGGEVRPLDSTYSKPSSSPAPAPPLQSYVMTPLQKPPPQKTNPNDYGIEDLRSDESTDEDSKPKKEVPLWAKGSQLRKQLFDQEHYPAPVDAIFPGRILLQMPDLSAIFPRQRSRFHKRTSSAVWNTPPYKVLSAMR